MENINISEENVLRYLLGELSDQDQSALEERFITDSESFTLLCEVEDDLIADYVRGRLESGDQRRFEGHFLDRNRERVRFAQVFLPLIDRAELADQIETRERLTFWQKLSSSVPILRWAIGMIAALSLLVIGLGGSWLVDETRRMHAEVEALRLESKRKENELLQQIDDEKRRNLQLTHEIEQLRSQATSTGSAQPAAAATGVVQHLIVAEALRDDNVKPSSSFIIPSAAKKVELIYKMEDPGYPEYRAELYSAAGEKIWSDESLSPRLNRSVATLTITLPASELASGSYTLSVSGVSKTGGVDPLGKPTFQVENKGRE